jgi:outer membrane biogenesis lipoprotein LolB
MSQKKKYMKTKLALVALSSSLLLIGCCRALSRSTRKLRKILDASGPRRE